MGVVFTPGPDTEVLQPSAFPTRARATSFFGSRTWLLTLAPDAGASEPLGGSGGPTGGWGSA